MLPTELEKLKKGKVRLADLKAKVQSWKDDYNAGKFTNTQFAKARHMAAKGIHPKTRLRVIYSELEKHFAHELLTKTDDFAAFGISPRPTLENIEASECETVISEIDAELDKRIAALSGEKTPECFDEPQPAPKKNYNKMTKAQIIEELKELQKNNA